MTTLKNILDLMPYAALDFDFDSFVQIVDNYTGAHYRMNEKNELLLGGNPVLCSMDEFLKLPVKCIEYIDDQCVISL